MKFSRQKWKALGNTIRDNNLLALTEVQLIKKIRADTGCSLAEAANAAAMLKGLIHTSTRK